MLCAWTPTTKTWGSTKGRTRRYVGGVLLVVCWWWCVGVYYSGLYYSVSTNVFFGDVALTVVPCFRGREKIWPVDTGGSNNNWWTTLKNKRKPECKHWNPP